MGSGKWEMGNGKFILSTHEPSSCKNMKKRNKYADKIKMKTLKVPWYKQCCKQKLSKELKESDQI